MKRGFRFAETMSGTFATPGDPDTRRRFVFSIEARAPSIWGHLRSGGQTQIHGTLEADGLAQRAPIEGTLTLAPLTRRVIRYEFDFTADDGRACHFEGQKDISLRDLAGSFTYLPGVVRDAEGREIAQVETQFDLGADWFQFLASWRPA